MFDPTKPVKTRDGRKARIVCTDRMGYWGPILALVQIEVDREEAHNYRADGRLRSDKESHLDLVNIPEAIDVLVYVYKGTRGTIYRATAPLYETEHCVLIAKKVVQLEEGEGL